MSKAESLFIKDWEARIAKGMGSISWMKEQYGATDVEVELEAMTNVLTHVASMGFLDAQEMGDEELHKQMTQLKEFARNMEGLLARESLSKKHSIWSNNEQNGKIK
ncbi:MAG: hypothetical protein WBD86_01180 [Microgenomates group bacterium]